MPKSRDEFDPTPLLAKLEGGKKILVMDSKKDLPVNWRRIDLKESYGLANAEEADVGNVNSDNASSDDCPSSDIGSTSDEAGTETATPTMDEDLVRDTGEYQDVAMEHTINVEAVKEPKRVLVFSTTVLLGLLSVCKYGSVDGTFKAMTRKWKQLFVFMVNYHGAFLPVAFGWLPDKSAVSYLVFLILVLEKFQQEQANIAKLYARGTLKVKKIKLDFEVAIHRAFEVLFKLRGCFFHFSQAGWRRVQKGGMVVPYMTEKHFRDFIRSVIALAFLPLNQIEAAIDDLRAATFNEESAFYEKMNKFKDEYLDYIEDTWIHGSFPPKLWNQWKKASNLTNNNNEGYNSRVNKIIAVIHPNPWVLVCMLVKELIRAEMEALWIKVEFFSSNNIS